MLLPFWVEGSLVFNEGVTFYPASGLRRQNTGTFNDTGSYGYAWSCAVTNANGYDLRFNNAEVGSAYSLNRAYGLPVRCVQNLLLFQVTKRVFFDIRN